MLVYNPLLFQNKVMKKCGGKVLAIINIIVVARFFFWCHFTDYNSEIQKGETPCPGLHS